MMSSVASHTSLLVRDDLSNWLLRFRLSVELSLCLAVTVLGFQIASRLMNVFINIPFFELFNTTSMRACLFGRHALVLGATGFTAAPLYRRK